MEPTAGTATRSSPDGGLPDDTGLDSLQFREEIQRLITAPPENGTSFTALLELPATQAMELLNSSNSDGVSKRVTLFNGEHKPFLHPVSVNSTAPPISSPVQLAEKFPGFIGELSPEATSSVAANSNANLEKVKSEPVAEANSTTNLLRPSLDPSLENANQKSAKRKEPEKKGKGSAKKSKTEKSENSEKLPYVHVRARRGEATDSHSLAERARREKINARMKLLQELVPGCNKVSGTALVLDEIINHVQSLQRQVEFLSMRLAAVNPRIDFNLDSLFGAESPSLVASNFPGMVTPFSWPEGPSIGNRKLYHHPLHLDPIHHASWGREDDNRNFITPENSLLTYDSPISAASLHSSQLKMEL